jgi:hypothetical protein
MPPEDHQLHYIERLDYRGHLIKIARRGDQIRLLIYPPETSLATRMVTDAIGNYEDAIHAAKRVVDEMMTEAAGFYRFQAPPETEA